MTEEVQEEVATNENAAVEAAPESAPRVSSNQEVQGTQGSQAPTWKYADGVAGDGDVPDWFMADKYKSVAEQAKAAHELRKKLGSKAEDAPEHYELNYEELGIDKEDVILNEFSGFFKEMNVPQKDYEKIVGKFVEIQQRQNELMEQQRASAYEAFGPETRETVGRLNTWIDNNFSDSEKEIVKGFMGSAEEIRVLEKMRQGAPKSAPPTVHQVAHQSNFETLDSINAEIQSNWSRMQSDDGYRKMMLAKRSEAHKREGR